MFGLFHRVFGIFRDFQDLKPCHYWYPIATTWFPRPYNYDKPYYNLLLPYLRHTVTLYMLENDKNHLFYGHFLAFFGVFWWFYPCQYGYIGSTFCFSHADNHYKPHYKLLTQCVHLRLTLYIVRNGKSHIFSVLGAGAWLPSQHALWTDGSASYGQIIIQSISPRYPGKITSVASQHIGCW